MSEQFTSLVNYMTNHGATHHEARTAVDLAVHAVDEAVKKVIQITDLAPGEFERTAAYLIALRMLHTNIGAVLDEKEK